MIAEAFGEVPGAMVDVAQVVIGYPASETSIMGSNKLPITSGVHCDEKIAMVSHWAACWSELNSNFGAV